MTKSPGSEEPPIDLSDPELANAATKIQANFRGHITRKQAHKNDNEKGEASGDDLAKEMDEKLKTADQNPPEEEIDIDLNDPAVEAAAAKIQASFRGHMKMKKKPCDKK